MTLYGPLKTAMLRPLAVSFLNALQKHAPLVPIDWALAQAQHEAYSRVVAECVESVVVVPADEAFPDCCFIEDTALVVGRDVVITRIGAESRRGESEAVSVAVQELGVAANGGVMHRLLAPATLDGGDVLQMREHVFVGLSARTNQAAVDQLRDCLPERRVSPVRVVDGLHLKSVLSAVSDDVLLAADTEAGRSMAGEVMDGMGAGARCVFVPDVVAANVLRLGDVLVVQAGFLESERIIRGLAAELGLRVVTLNMSELVKADGALTCCSLLFPG